MRGLLRQALEHLGVAEVRIEEIVLALTEACANVIDHAGEHEEYQVDVAITDELCVISVLDDGQGFEFDPDSHASSRSPLEDHGRGLILMQALVDRLQFVKAEDGRHRVTLEKRLSSEAQSQPHLRLLPD
ncbi:ATP-binding protein [Blastococcus sp. TF02-8]|nr:ATP-binding protein [Blastococcus sp. TF02-8]